MDAQMRTIQKKRTANFREDETKLLIQLWGNPLIQNKLFLTHRKAPVMRILAANMQQRGFYRTPDEIKTRIRNLKCLYHRIKRTMSCGTGIGTVDPDWPHFKAMDAILSKQVLKNNKDPLAEAALEGPKCEDIKQEIDIDFNDDIDSWATNDSVGSDYEEHATPPPLRPAPSITIKSTDQLKANNTASTSEFNNKNLPTIVPSFTLPSTSIQTTQTTTNGIRTGTVPSIPVPLLILNSLQPQHTHDKKDGNVYSFAQEKLSNDLHSTLRNLVEVQKETLEVERQRLNLEKQRLDFDRLVGTQLITLIPMIGGFVQRLAYTTPEESPDTSQSKRAKKRSNLDDVDMFKGSKVLRTMLEQGIKQYMLSDLRVEKESSSSSDNEDSSIQNDENSNAATKD